MGAASQRRSRTNAAALHATAVVVMMPMVAVTRDVRSGVIALVDAQHAFDAADNSADCRADDGADRAGNAVALVKAVNGSAGNALGLCGERHGERREARAGNDQFYGHGDHVRFSG